MGMRGLPTELDLFLWLKKHYYYDLRSNAGQYSFYDCWSAEFRFYAELKVRHTHYDKLIIEKQKWARVLDVAAASRADALYICSTPAGVWQFDLAELDIDWVNMPDLPATTDFDDQTRVIKRVGLLATSAGWQLGEGNTRRKGGAIYGNR